ncbi:MAG: peptide-methionine (S)-S-oxide reductase MsrA [Burkholderiaceae bacterium]|jgi:peptide-methionine (S)-S-oxide reductase|nr:peptide-methionine (S)-S-oxide reductase MsrA [Burkholderiaceae bacterium]
MKEEIATLGGGCFWCVEAVFRYTKGVISTVSGYAGGHVSNPTYGDVCGGKTGHAEVVQMTFDSDSVSYLDLLEVFFATHDPTTLNRQGSDVGPQYRSVVFFHSPEQEKSARTLIAELERVTRKHLVTEVIPFSTFYPADDNHQNYFNTHRDQPYCTLVVAPKIQQLPRRYLK